MKIKTLMVFSSLLVLSACQTISTKTQKNITTPFPNQAPRSFTVRDFETDTLVLNQDADRNMAGQVMAELNTGLVQELEADGYSARILPKGAKPGSSGWVVTGRLRVIQWTYTDPGEVQVPAGDHIAGTVYVYDLAKSRTQPFMTFDVTQSRVSGEGADDQVDSLSATCQAATKTIERRIQTYIKQTFRR